jgi:hypothetical protein
MQQARLKRLTSEELDQLMINTIRTLSIDAVQQAKSGHLGTPGIARCTSTHTTRSGPIVTASSETRQ